MSNVVNHLASLSQIDIEKEQITSHPLFPLMKYLFERCEYVMNDPKLLNTMNFDEELEKYISDNNEKFREIATKNPYLDELLYKSIQVLRIHLLELEKVNELCKDFCQRYSTCLKVKLNSENIFKNEFDNYSDDNNESMENDDFDDENEEALQSFSENKLSNSKISTTVHNLSISTPLSQIGLKSNQNSEQSFHHHFDNDFDLNVDDDDDVNGSGKKKNKRGILPKYATNIMKQWLFQHITHPYPTEDEKKQIASQTNLTLIQVNNWFINARRRIVQPILEASNPDMAKKKKTSSISAKPYQNNRYWPQSIANLALKTERHISNASKFKQLSESRNDDDDTYSNNSNASTSSFNASSSFTSIENSKNVKSGERSMCNALRIENLLSNNDCSYSNGSLQNHSSKNSAYFSKVLNT